MDEGDTNISRTQLSRRDPLPAKATLPLGFQPGRPETPGQTGTLGIPGTPNDPLARSFKLAAIAAEVLVLIAGTIGAIGWAYSIAMIKRPTGDPYNTLQSPAAVSFVLLAAAILLLGVGSPRLWRRVIGRSLAAIVIVASSYTFIQHTCHVEWEGIVFRPVEGFGLKYPGDLVPHEAFFLVLLGVGTVLFNRVTLNRGIALSQIIAGIVFVPSFMVLVFNILGYSELCTYLSCAHLSAITTIICLICSAGLFFADPTIGLARMFCLKSKTGVLVRRTFGAVAILFAALLPRQQLIAWANSSQIADASMINFATATVVVGALIGFFVWCFRTIETEQTEKQLAVDEKEQAIEILQSHTQGREPRQLKLVCLECRAEYSDRSMTHCLKDDAPLVSIMDVLTPGSIFDDVYRIEKELGSGGMSTVYLAEHLLMNKKVAVKVLQTQFASDVTTIQRFQRESQAASALSHPNLVVVHDFKITEHGQAYLVMEFLEGLSLSELLAGGKPLRWREALVLLGEICDGLEHAHSKGIIHRDLKPGNIMLLPADTAERRFTPKIVDFGLAKVWDRAGLQLTHTGEVFGSPLYMCPEQCRGEPMDPRSDIYAMGCIMYATLTGEPPFAGSNPMETMIMHITQPPAALPADLGVPPWFEKIVHKALAKDPAARFQTVAELKAALGSL